MNGKSLAEFESSTLSTRQPQSLFLTLKNYIRNTKTNVPYTILLIFKQIILNSFNNDLKLTHNICEIKVYCDG